MIRRATASWLLLSAFAISVSLMSLFELGHVVLHQFPNPFHYHASSILKPRHYHTIADHHLKKQEPKVPIATQQADFPVFLFGIMQQLVVLKALDGKIILHNGYLQKLWILCSAPPSSPPPWR